MTSTTTLLAWRNIWRHPRRTQLTVAAMVFANILLVFLLGLQFGQYRMMIDNSLRLLSGQMQVQFAGYQDEPDIHNAIAKADELAQKIRAKAGLEAVTPRAEAFVLLSSSTRSLGVQITGVDPRYEPQVSSIPGLVKSGRYLKDEISNELVIGSVLARNLNVEVGDELTLLGNGRDGSIAATISPVVGIFESGNRDVDRQMLYMPINAFRDLFIMPDMAHRIVIGGDRDQSESIADRIHEVISGNDELVLLDWQQLMPGLKQAIQADLTSAWIMYAVLIVLVAFGMMNTMLMSVLERTHEFGILLALGVGHGRLARMIITESVLLALVGLLVGLLIGASINGYLHIHGFSYPGLEEMGQRFNIPPVIHPEISVRALLPGPLAVFLASILASIWPIWHTRKLRPVEAMQAI